MKTSKTSVRSDRNDIKELLSTLFVHFFWYAIFFSAIFIVIYVLLDSSQLLKSSLESLAIRSLILSVIPNILSVLVIYIITYLFVTPFRRILDSQISEDLADKIANRVSNSLLQEKVINGSPGKPDSAALKSLLITITARSREQNCKVLLPEDLMSLQQGEYLTLEDVKEIIRKL